MEILNIAEKFLAFDNIYDATGSNFEEIYEYTNKMFDNLYEEKLLNGYLDKNFKNMYLDNIFYCDSIYKKDELTDEYIEIKENTISDILNKYDKLNFFIIYLKSLEHAFSLSFVKTNSGLYNIYFFNSGSGINMHTFDETKKLYGCFLIKKDTNLKTVKKILDSINNYYGNYRNKKTLKEIYTVLILPIFKNDNYSSNEYLCNYVEKDNIIYIKDQATGNCTGRALLYHMIPYYIEICGFNINDSLDKFKEFQMISSLLIFSRIIKNINLKNSCHNEYSKNYYNEYVELIGIIKIIVNKFKKETTNIIILDEIDKLNLNLENYIDFNYLNNENLLKLPELDLTDKIKLPKNHLIDFKIIDEFKITNNDEFISFLNNFNIILEQINSKDTTNNNLFKQIYYSIKLKKILYEIYNSLEYNFTYNYDHDQYKYEFKNYSYDSDNEDYLNYGGGENNKDNIIKICELLTNIFNQFNILKKIHNTNIDMKNLYYSSIVLFLYINFEIFNSYFGYLKKEAYPIYFKKINFDWIDKKITMKNTYYMNELDYDDVNNFLNYNKIDCEYSYEIKKEYINYKNIKNETNYNMYAIYNLLVLFYKNEVNVNDNQPLISNYFSFINYLMKINSNGYKYINLEKYDDVLIDINTFISAKYEDDYGYSHNENRSLFIHKKDSIIGFNEFDNVLKDYNNKIYDTINNILDILEKDNSLKKDNVESLIKNLTIYCEMYYYNDDNKEIIREKIKNIVNNYEINSLVISLLIETNINSRIKNINRLILKFNELEIINNNNYDLIRYYKFSNNYNLSVGYSNDENKKYNNDFHIIYNNYLKLEKTYNDFTYLSLILLNNEDIIDEILIKNKIIYANKKYFIKFDNFFYKNDNKYLFNFCYLDQDINIIVKIYFYNEELLYKIFNNLLNIFNKYKNFDVFNNKEYVYENDILTFQNYTINLITDEILINDKKLINYTDISSNILTFINNYLSFENKMYLNIFDDKIELTRYNVIIDYSNNNFKINNNYEIITDFSNKYYLYRWIYGTNNILVVKDNLKYKILLFNHIYNNENNQPKYKKTNEFWKIYSLYKEQFELNETFKYYIFDINPNMLYLDININDIESIITLCYTYIFFNKINEYYNLLNIINSFYKNRKYFAKYEFKLYDFVNEIELNTPFVNIIKAQFLIKDNINNLINQYDYFNDFFNINEIYTNKTREIIINSLGSDYKIIKLEPIKFTNINEEYCYNSRKINLDLTKKDSIYLNIDTTNLFDYDYSFNKILNNYIEKNKQEELIDIQHFSKKYFINILDILEKKLTKEINTLSFEICDVRNKIISIMTNSFLKLIKPINDIINLYDEFDITQETNDKEIILKDISRKLIQLKSYHTDKKESNYVHIYETIFGYYIKEEQNDLVNNIYNQFTSTPENRYFHQLLMGAGKTSVVNPLLNIKLINNTNDKFIINILPESLVNQSYNILITNIKYLLNIDVIIYDIDRNTDISKIKFENNKIYIMSDSSYKSYLLNNIEKQSVDYKIIKDSAYIIIDEVDLVNDTLKSETNFPIGNKLIPDNLLSKINFIYKLLDIIIETNYEAKILEFIETNPNIVLIKEESYNKLLEYHKDKFVELIREYLPLEEQVLINRKYEDLLFSNKNIFSDISENTIINIPNIYFIKTIFKDLLPLVLKLKHRLNYGLVNDYNKETHIYNYIAIPYLALDIPAKTNNSSSEFSNYYIKIMLTYLSYKSKNSIKFRDLDILRFLTYTKNLYVDFINKTKGKVNEEQMEFIKYFNQLKTLYDVDNNINNIDIADFNYDNLIKNLKISKNIKIYNDFIKYYLKINFMEYIKIDKDVLNCSFLDLLSPRFSKYTSGFTGTPYFYLPYENKDKLEYNIKYNEDDNKIISGLTNKFEGSDIFIINNNIEIIDKTINNNYDVLIDVGSYFINLSSYEVIKKIQEKSVKKYFIFIDKDHKKKYITKDDDTIKIFNENIVPLNDRFIYFDNGHITGQDFKLIPSAKGLVTINIENNYRDVAQGIFRLRKLNFGQQISYAISKKTCEYINLTNLKDLVEWLYKQNIKQYQDKEKIGLIQNIRREIKDSNIQYYKTQIENFVANSPKTFYYSNYDFILNDLEIKNNSLNILANTLIAKYKTNRYDKILLQEQQEEQMQNTLQETIYENKKHLFEYFNINFANYHNNELLLSESMSLHNIYKNNKLYPVVHMLYTKNNYIYYYLSNYVNIVTNLLLYNNKNFTIIDMNGNEIINTLDKTKTYIYNSKNVTNIDNIFKSKYYISNILLDKEVNDFSYILQFIKYFMETSLEIIFDNFNISYSKTLNEKWNDFNNIIKNYITKYNNNTNILDYLLEINYEYITYDAFEKSLNKIINVIYNCSSINDNLDTELTNKEQKLLLIILNIDTNTNNICKNSICNQFNIYNILSHYKKDISALFSKYSQLTCNKEDPKNKIKIVVNNYDEFKILIKHMENNESIENTEYIENNKILLLLNNNYITYKLTQQETIDLIMNKYDFILNNYKYINNYLELELKVTYQEYHKFMSPISKHPQLYKIIHYFKIIYTDEIPEENKKKSYLTFYNIRKNDIEQFIDFTTKMKEYNPHIYDNVNLEPEKIIGILTLLIQQFINKLSKYYSNTEIINKFTSFIIEFIEKYINLDNFDNISKNKIIKELLFYETNRKLYFDHIPSLTILETIKIDELDEDNKKTYLSSNSL